MKSQDLVYVGAPIGPALDPLFNMKGYRVAPVLAAGASAAEVVAAYAPLRVQVTRNSQSRALSGLTPGVIDDVPVNGPDWIRNPGFNLLLISAGLVGTTYRIWWAEDCFEIVDAASPPYLAGLAPGSPPTAYSQQLIGPALAVTQLANSLAGNVPTNAADGIAVPRGASGAYVAVDAGVGATISAMVATSGLFWWRYVSSMARWCPLELAESYTVGGRTCAGMEQALAACRPGDRLYVEARSFATSTGNPLEVWFTVA